MNENLSAEAANGNATVASMGDGPRERVIALWRAGQSVAKIQAATGMLKTTIRVIIGAHRYSTGLASERERDAVDRSVATVEEGLTQMQAAKRLNVSQPTVCYHLGIYELATGERVARAGYSEGAKCPIGCQCRACIRGREIDAEVRLKRRIGWPGEWTLEDYAMRRRVADGSRFDDVDAGITRDERKHIVKTAAPANFGMNKMHRKEAHNG